MFYRLRSDYGRIYLSLPFWFPDGMRAGEGISAFKIFMYPHLYIKDAMGYKTRIKKDCLVSPKNIQSVSLTQPLNLPFKF